jgi:hypothetical protein
MYHPLSVGSTSHIPKREKKRGARGGREGRTKSIERRRTYSNKVAFTKSILTLPSQEYDKPSKHLSLHKDKLITSILYSKVLPKGTYPSCIMVFVLDVLLIHQNTPGTL